MKMRPRISKLWIRQHHLFTNSDLHYRLPGNLQMRQTRDVNYQRMKRAASAAYIIFSLACCAAKGQNPALDAEAKWEATKVWDTILTRCGDSYYYSGSNMEPNERTAWENQKMMEEARGIHTHKQPLILTEHQGAKFEVHLGRMELGGESEESHDKRWPVEFPWPEGVIHMEWWGVATLQSSEARQLDAGSGKWVDLPKMTDPEELWTQGSVLGRALNEEFPLGSRSEIHIQMWKLTNGKWYFSRSSLAVQAFRPRSQIGRSGPRPRERWL
jgi:hypothetical protein